jgi:ribonuclease HI
MTINQLHEIKIYTDGACSGNPGPGGWGTILIFGNYRKELYGGEKETTNNRMELLATIKGLEALKYRCKVHIYTDSKYVKEGISAWIFGWKKNGWRTADGKEVKNQDLWKKLDELQLGHYLEWHWVKGHAGDIENEKADELARKGIESIKK